MFIFTLNFLFLCFIFCSTDEFRFGFVLNTCYFLKHLLMCLRIDIIFLNLTDFFPCFLSCFIWNIPFELNYFLFGLKAAAGLYRIPFHPFLILVFLKIYWAHYKLFSLGRCFNQINKLAGILIVTSYLTFKKHFSTLRLIFVLY